MDNLTLPKRLNKSIDRWMILNDVSLEAKSGYC